MEFLVFIIILMILGFLLEKIINKLVGIDKKAKTSETSGKKIDRWGRGIILVLFLCTIPFIITKDTNVVKWYWTLYLIVLLGFQAILEWKYLRNSKQYVATLIFLILGVVFMCNIEYFFELLNWTSVQNR